MSVLVLPSVLAIGPLSCVMDGQTTDSDSMIPVPKGSGARVRLTSLRFRYIFLVVTICGGAFFLLSINNGAELLFLTNYPTSPSLRSHHYEIVDTDNRFTLKTEGCTIPGLRAFDPSVSKFVKYPKLLTPCPNHNVSLLESNDTHIWIQRDFLPYYHTSKDSSISCCYKPFYRPSDVEDVISILVDDRVRYKSCRYFSDHIEVKHEFVKVTCISDFTSIYEQYFLFATVKELQVYSDEDVSNASSIPQNETTSTTPPLYNVLILGMDAISRLNFRRTMPKTLAYLKKKGSIELFGYNKVGDNTFPNLTPMLLGIRVEDLKTTCWPNMRATFDNCPFIWEWYKELGYYTALGEDSSSLGTFNYGKFGFTRTPTDYHIHTFMNEAENNVGNNRDFNSFICMNNKYFYKVLLDYVERLAWTLRSSKLFGFFWEVTMSHDYLNYPMAMDDDYANFLKKLDEFNYLDDTILILLSDHGIRWGRIRYTKQGRLEERLPLVHILMPQSFRDNYSLAYNNLKVNTKRLTTPFDIHATLYDLLKLENIQNDKIKSRSESSYAQDRSISLFLPIPTNRTCKLAGIADHWCTCHTGKKLATDSAEARESSIHLIRHMNSLLKGHRQCAKLKLAEVIEVSEMTSDAPDINEVGWHEYMVVVRTTPGGGLFEATMRRDNLEWTISGTISRLNLYGTQSRCVSHYQLKLYCYCN